MWLKWPYLHWRLQGSLLGPLKHTAYGNWIYNLLKKTLCGNFFPYIWLEISYLLERVKEDSDTHLYTACPGEKALLAAVCSTGRWWDGCSCESQRCEEPSHVPAPSSPSRLADRSTMASASLAPEGGAAAVESNGRKNKIQTRTLATIHILFTVHIHILHTT